MDAERTRTESRRSSFRKRIACYSQNANFAPSAKIAFSLCKICTTGTATTFPGNAGKKMKRQKKKAFMRRLKAFGERRVGRDREFYVTICCVALVLLQPPCQTNFAAGIFFRWQPNQRDVRELQGTQRNCHSVTRFAHSKYCANFAHCAFFALTLTQFLRSRYKMCRQKRARQFCTNNSLYSYPDR